ncbi:endolytic transglycosylase MltG [Streptomyces sp. NPDC050504]|uniref:endolytic transglycosylase MltG n=1 Tax=Streptomyces sp. NPDC050504 TaxID=3365618 RepID=UPI0037A025E1
MTEYGRGPGSEPWHPEDPLYGDQGWGGQQPQHGQNQPGQQQYGQHQQQYGQNEYGAQQQYGDQQGYPQQAQYGNQPDPYQSDPYQQDPYQQDPYGQQQYGDGNGGWDTGQQHAMPYGVNAADPYADQQANAGYGPEADYYSTPEAYPPPQPPGRRAAAPEQTEWEPEAEADDHPFFSDGEDGAAGEGRAARRAASRAGARRDDGDEDLDDADHERTDSRRGGRGRTKKQKKGRSGVACLFIAVVLVGGVGGVGYFGYQFWQDKFGAPEDYAGEGSGSVEIEIPKNAGGYEIGNILVRNGVVKSQGAFVAAQNSHEKGKFVQEGTYVLKKGMSAQSALALMLDPKSRSNFMVTPGQRNIKVYAAMDKRLGLKAGTTAGVARSKAGSLGLPDWAGDNPKIKDPLEGFLHPGTYAATKGAKPEDILKKMVAQATAAYEKAGFQEKYKALKLDSPFDLVIIASLVEAEGKSHDDFRKMSEVAYNRLASKTNETVGKLQFDSTYNYLTGQSKTKISNKDVQGNTDPYNTYHWQGLPPGPIGNPGTDAISATLDPTDDGWMFFISLDDKTTKFTKTLAEHEKLNEQLREKHGFD